MTHLEKCVTVKKIADSFTNVSELDKWLSYKNCHTKKLVAVKISVPLEKMCQLEKCVRFRKIGDSQKNMSQLKWDTVRKMCHT